VHKTPAIAVLYVSICITSPSSCRKHCDKILQMNLEMEDHYLATGRSQRPVSLVLLLPLLFFSAKIFLSTNFYFWNIITYAHSFDA
jgi:hypothetical protein